MSAGGAGAGFTVSTGEAALSRLLSSIIMVACSGAAMLCYRAAPEKPSLRKLTREGLQTLLCPSSSRAREGKR